MANNPVDDLNSLLGYYLPTKGINQNFQERKRNDYQFNTHTLKGIMEANTIANLGMNFLMDINEKYGSKSSQHKSAVNYFLTTILYVMKCELVDKVVIAQKQEVPDYLKPIYKQSVYTSNYILEAIKNFDKLFPFQDLLTIPNIQERREVQSLVSILDRKVNNKKGCYIATIIYNDYNSSEVLFLRWYRDIILDKTYMGRIWVKLYYLFYPVLYPLTKRNYLFQKLIKCFLNFILKHLIFKHKKSLDNYLKEKVQKIKVY